MNARTRGIGLAAVFLAVVVGAAVAISAGASSSKPTVRSVGSTTTSLAAAVPPSSAAPSTTAPAGPSGEAVTIAFAGDTHFYGGLRATLLANPSGALGPIAAVLSAADLTMLNFESAITERGTPAPGKEFTFRSPASSLTALKAAGVDVVSVANNHGLDYGPVGLQDTIDAGKAAGFPIIGIGTNDTEAFTPFRTTIKGQRIAIIAATDVIDANLISSWTATASHAGLASSKRLDRITAEVKAARADSDTVVVFLHWGTETVQCPGPAQKNLATALVAAGADIVVGSHAHVEEGAGRMGDAFVAYGLGNFAFYHAKGLGSQTGVLTLTVRGRHVDSYTWNPALIPGAGGVPRPLTGTAKTAAVAAWEKLRPCTGLTP